MVGLENWSRYLSILEGANEKVLIHFDFPKNVIFLEAQIGFSLDLGLTLQN